MSTSSVPLATQSLKITARRESKRAIDMSLQAIESSIHYRFVHWCVCVDNRQVHLFPKNVSNQLTHSSIRASGFEVT